MPDSDPPPEDYGEETDEVSDFPVRQDLTQRRTEPAVEDAAPKKKKPRVKVCLDNCKYPVVHRCSESRGWREILDSEDWLLQWTDYGISGDKVSRMRTYQRINHFPGMSELTRKDSLARNLNRARKVCPDEYSFFPPSFFVPQDSNELRNFIMRAPKKNVYISKPAASCQGRGIRLFKTLDTIDLTEPQVIQQYLANPYLIGGLKFDLRMYVIVLSVVPYLRLLVYRDGMARFATEPYQEPSYRNLRHPFMHLTNYAINKRNEHFVFNEDEEADNSGSKWGLHAIWDQIRKDGGDVEKLQADIDAIFIKTLLAGYASIEHVYRTARTTDTKDFDSDNPADYVYSQSRFANTPFAGSCCFEVLGFDIFIDDTFRPWLIEVNHTPSFSCDTPLDLRIKQTLINTVFDIINVNPADRRLYQRMERIRHMKRVYGSNFGKMSVPPAAPRPPAGAQKKVPSKYSQKALKAVDKRSGSASSSGSKASKSRVASAQRSASSAPRPRLPTFLAYDSFVRGCCARLPCYQIYPLPPQAGAAPPDPYYDILSKLKNPFGEPRVVTDAVLPAGGASASAGRATPSSLGEKRPDPPGARDGTVRHTQATPFRANSGRDSAVSDSRPGYSPPRQVTSQYAQNGSYTATGRSDKEAIDSVLKRALQEFEYGIPTRSIVFKGRNGPVLLPQGAGRNDKVERQRDIELASKMRAMLKCGVRESVEMVVRLGQHPTPPAQDSRHFSRPPGDSGDAGPAIQGQLARGTALQGQQLPAPQYGSGRSFPLATQVPRPDPLPPQSLAVNRSKSTTQISLPQGYVLASRIREDSTPAAPPTRSGGGYVPRVVQAYNETGYGVRRRR